MNQLLSKRLVLKLFFTQIQGDTVWLLSGEQTLNYEVEVCEKLVLTEELLLDLYARRLASNSVRRIRYSFLFEAF